MVSWAEVDIHFGPIGWQDVNDLRLEEEENHENAPQKSQVESLLLDVINNGSLGNLKVDTFSVGSTIPGVYKNFYDGNFECT